MYLVNRFISTDPKCIYFKLLGVRTFIFTLILDDDNLPPFVIYGCKKLYVVLPKKGKDSESFPYLANRKVAKK